MRRYLLLTVIISIIVISLCACGPGITDYSYEVGTGYQVFRSSAHSVSVVPIENGSDKPIIPTKVVQIAWNDRYVLAKRNGMKQVYPDPNNLDYSHTVPDESIVEYYILDTIDFVLYGGFDFQEFEEKKKELNISDKLVLEDTRKAGSR